MFSCNDILYILYTKYSIIPVDCINNKFKIFKIEIRVSLNFYQESHEIV